MIRNSPTKNLPYGEHIIFKNLKRPQSGHYVVQTIKDYFRLYDKYPSKVNYWINWEAFFRREVGIWVSPRVLSTLSSEDEGLYSVFSDWGENAVTKIHPSHFQKDLFKGKGFKGKGTKKIYDTKKLKFAKLYQPISENQIGSLLLRGNFVKPISVFSSVENPPNKGVVGLEKAVNQTPFYQDMGFQKKASAVINFMSDSKNWFLNYDQGVIELNASKAPNSLFVTDHLLVGLGLSIFEKALTSKQRRKWKRLLKKEKPSLRSRLRFSNELSKFRFGVAFGLGFAGHWKKSSMFDSDVAKTLSNFLRWEKEDTILSAPDGVPPEVGESIETVFNDFMSQSNLSPEGKKIVEDLNLTPESIVKVAGISALTQSVDGINPSYFESFAMGHRYFERSNKHIVSIYTDFDEDELFSFERSFEVVGDEKILYNSHFMLDPDEVQGRGIGRKMIEQQLVWAVDNGVTKIQTYASKGDYDLGKKAIKMSGYAIWHKFGYNGTITSENLDDDTGNRTEFFEYTKTLAKKNLAGMSDSQAREVFEEMFVEIPSKIARTLPVYEKYRPSINAMLNGNWNKSQDAQLLFDKKDLEDTWEVLATKNFLTSRSGVRFFDEYLSKNNLHPFKANMQDLMSMDGFENWWKDNGDGWKAAIDLSEGVHSEAFLIMEQYRKKKGEVSRLAVEDEIIFTKGMGSLFRSDIELIDQARIELKLSKKIAKRILG